MNSKDGIKRGPFGSSLKKSFFVKKSDYVVYEQQNAIYDQFSTRYFINEVKYNELEAFSLKPNDFILSGSGTIGCISLVPDNIKKGVINQALIRIRINQNITNKFFFLQWMRSSYMQRRLTQANPGSAITNLVPISEIKNWKVTVPNNKIQKHIGKILTQLDSLLSLQQRKLELEKALEKSLFQNLYTDFPNIFPKLAFEKSPWHAIKLQDAFTEISKRSKAGQLLTVSISKGIFPFNESERKNNSSSDKSKYKVVKINDIAYNTMRMWQGAEAVSRYDGIVSPAYTVIRAKKNQNPFFYAFMFKREKYLYLFQTYSQGLTSDTWNLKYPLFKEIKAMIPENLYIQDKIANILNTRLKHTELENTKLETFQALKQFLLQNLFI